MANLNEYVQVNDRIEKFYKKYPDGSIQTEIIHNENGVVIMKSYAYRHPDDPRPATGMAMEKEGSSPVNRTSHIENCETSAVGRALAMLGFEIKKAVASREEIQNAVENKTHIGVCISDPQRKKLFTMAKGNNDLIKKVINKFGYESSKEIKKSDYEKICTEISTDSQKVS